MLAKWLRASKDKTQPKVGVNIAGFTEFETDNSTALIGVRQDQVAMQ